MQSSTTAQGRRVRIAAALGIALFLSACGGGSDSDMTTSSPTGCSNASDCGGVMIGITDADGDFVRYAVAVQSLTLDRQDGTTVEALPTSVTIDLAQFTNVTELFSSATIPLGVYTAAHLQLDYSNADIAVERSGETIPAVAVDAGGQPLSTVDVDITFDNLARLTVRPGAPALLSIDFDLAASNTVDLTTTPITVTAQPFLLADVNPADGKTLHVGGALVATDTADTSYGVHLRPFHRHSGAFGDVTVHVDDGTTYEVNGTPYTGADGLAAIAQLPAGTATLAEVVENATAQELDATNVLAGSSVPGSDLDAVEGWVTQRSGAALTLHAATVMSTTEGVSFSDAFEVTLDTDPVVRESGDPESALDASSISVGQHVVAAGALVQDESGNTTLQASNVHLIETGVSGEVSSVQPGQLVMSLDAIDYQGPENFDFAGTGTSVDSDTDPLAYEVDTGSLPLAGLAPGASVRVFGLVAPFGAAPPDFLARTVANVSDSSWRLDVTWSDGSTAPFSSLEASGIVLDLSDPSLGNTHFMRRGGVLTNLLSLPASPPISPDRASGAGIYGIAQHGDIQVFLDFGRFVTELTSRLDGSTSVQRLHAVGGYDAGTNTFAADRITVQLE